MFKCHIWDRDCGDNDKGGRFGIGPTCFRAIKVALLRLHDGSSIAERFRLASKSKKYTNAKKFFKDLSVSLEESVSEFHKQIISRTENFSEAENFVKKNKDVAIALIEINELDGRCDNLTNKDDNEYYKAIDLIFTQIELIDTYSNGGECPQGERDRIKRIIRDLNRHYH